MTLLPTDFTNLRRVLLIASSHVGTNLFCTPAIRLLRRHLPQARVDLLATSWRGLSVFAQSPDVDSACRVYFRKTVRWIARNYDLVIGLHRTTAQRLAAGLHVPVVTVGESSPHKHRAHSALEFVAALLGCQAAEEERRYFLYPQPAHFARVRGYLRGTEGRKLVGVHLGTGHTAVHGWRFWSATRAKDRRIWPLENYLAMVLQLRETDPQLRFVLTGSRNERFLGKTFLRQVPEAINLIGRTSLLDLAALMPSLSVFITQDTGALHVACAMDIPLIGLFGPSQPEETGPYPTRAHHVVMRQQDVRDIAPAEVCAVVMKTVCC